MRNPAVYYRPHSVAEVVNLLSQPHVDAVLLSGGALRLATTADPDYEAVIDLQAVEGLDAIYRAEDGAVFLGACATLQAVAVHDVTPPLLRQVLTRSLSWNRRNGITVGEAVEFCDTLPEWTAALLAFGAEVIFSATEERRIPLAQVAQTPEQPRLPRKGLSTGVWLAPPVPLRVWGEAHVARTPADEAIVSVAAVLDVADGVVRQGRLALCGVWPGGGACLAEVASARLAGDVLDEDRIAGVLAALDQEIAPVSDYRGSAEYRRAMAGVLARRALNQCREQHRQINRGEA